jgi:quinoprotein glucose dehydrogenase
MTEAEIRGRIDSGKGMMPGFQFLTEAEKNAIVDFVLHRIGADLADTGEISADRSRTGDSRYINNGWKKFLDPDGYPAIKPPWGTLTAVDLNEGTIAWTVPLGHFPELATPGAPPTGTENYGGPVVTAGGILFIGAAKDEKFRAFDLGTGEVVWEVELPAGGYATPATYEVGGKQFVVIAAGGGRDTKPGDAYVAFALPE